MSDSFIVSTMIVTAIFFLFGSGYLIGSMKVSALKHELSWLTKEYERITDRDSLGRFTKNE